MIRSKSMIRPKSKKSPSSMPGQRQLRVGEIVRRALCSVFLKGNLLDPTLSKHSLTISEVRMSPDLRLAKVFILPLGGKTLTEADSKEIRDALVANRRWIRGQMGAMLLLKFTPDLRFFLDTRFDDDDRISAALSSFASLASPDSAETEEEGEEAEGEENP